MSSSALGVEHEHELGTAIRGPSALGRDPARFWRLAWITATTDFKLKFFGSVLGYLWQLVKPIALFGVLFVVFTVVIDLGTDTTYFATSLLLGIVLFSFLREMTQGAVRIVLEREGLVRKVDFPRLVLPVSVCLVALFNLGLNLVAVIVFLFIQGGQPLLSWLLFPFVVGFVLVLGFGLAMLLSATFVKARDIDPIWDVVMQALFYGSLIFIPIEAITGDNADTIKRALLCNPFAAALQEARHVLIDPSHPSLGAAMGGWIWVSIPVGITVLLLVWGWWTFKRMAPKIAELL